MRRAWRRTRAGCALARRRLGGWASPLLFAAREGRIGLAVAYVTVLVALAAAHGVSLESVQGRAFEGLLRWLQEGSSRVWLVALAVATAVQVLVARSRRRWVFAVITAVPLWVGAEQLVEFLERDAGAPSVLEPLTLVVPLAWGLAAAWALRGGRRGYAKTTLLLVELVAVGAALPVYVGQAMRDADFVGGSSAGRAGIQLVVVVFVLGALVAQLFSQEWPPRPPHDLEGAPTATGHFKSVRTFALLLFIPMYLSVDLADFLRTGNDALERARFSILTYEWMHAVEDKLGAGPPPFDLDQKALLPDVMWLRLGAHCDEQGKCRGTSHFTLGDGAQGEHTQEILASEAAARARGARQNLEGLLLMLGVRATADQGARELMYGIQDQVRGRTVQVPVVNLPLGATKARWVLGALVLVALVLLRGRLAEILRTGGAPAGEPWLPIDPGDRLERVLGALFILGIGVASSVVAAAVISANSRNPPLPLLGVEIGGHVLALGLSLSVVRSILRLRDARRAGRAALPVTRSGEGGC